MSGRRCEIKFRAAQRQPTASSDWVQVCQYWFDEDARHDALDAWHCAASSQNEFLRERERENMYVCMCACESSPTLCMNSKREG